MTYAHQQVVLALMVVCPGAQWTLEGDVFDTASPLPLQWHDTEQQRPTDQEIFAAII